MAEPTKNERMEKAYFFISGKNVQHVGCRLVVTKELIHANFKKGGAFNMPDGRVEVVLEGTREQIGAMRNNIAENLEGWLEVHTDGKDYLTKKMFKEIQNPGITVSEPEFDKDLLVLDIGLFSHALTFDQIYKGFDVYKDLKDAIKGLTKELGKSK